MIGSVLLDRYELIDDLGRGGMGVVYRARDTLLEREVAVKVLGPRLASDAETRFRREARLVAQMDHPGIVPIYDFGSFQGSLFFVMPLLRGTTLRRMLRAGPLTLAETLGVGARIAEALDYSHRLGVIHRDVKPSNVMVEREQDGLRVRVMDFGLAHEPTETPLTRSGNIMGTAAYSSPEQISDEPLDGRSDLYSLGALLYRCLAGEPPFTGSVRTILYRQVCEPVPSLRSRGVDIDPAIDRLLLSCLAKDPEERPATGRELAQSLLDLREGLGDSSGARFPVRRFERLRPETGPVPMVGRRRELAELTERFERALSGECHFVLIAGEEGAGKSRLLRELEQIARNRRVLVLRGRFAGLESALPYQGICELVQDYFRGLATGSLDPGSAPDLSDLASELVSLFPVLSEIPELNSVTGELRGIREKPGTDPTEVFELLARTLARISGGQPLVLILENIHAGDASIDALQYIIRRLGPTPTLIAATHLPITAESRHPLIRLLRRFEDDPRFLSIVLGPLDRRGFDRLARHLLDNAELEEGVSERLWEATEGNPFFGQELIRSLRESGGLTRDRDGRWSLTGEAALSTGALPSTIQQTVERRIERLPPELRELLAQASVLGRSFAFEDLEQISDEPELESAIEALLEQELLNEDRKSRGDRLRFASSVVREYLYQSFPRRRRRAVHRQLAEHLERRYAGRLERVYPQLVHHFSEGDVADKTVEYALALARRALRAFSHEDAIRAAHRAMEFVDEEEVSSAPQRKGDLLRIVAEAHLAVGETERALREAEQAAVAFEEAGQERRAGQAALLAAEIAWQGRLVEEARVWVDRGAEKARASGDRETLHRLLQLGGTVSNLRGQHQDARVFLEEAEKLGEDRARQRAEEAFPAGGSLVTVLPNPVSELRPGLIRRNEETEISGLFLERLLATDPHGNLVTSLCREWEGREDGREFRIELRDDVRFADGTRLTAVIVKASLEAAAKGTDQPAAALQALQGIEELRRGEQDEISGIRVEGEHRLSLHLSEPLPILPALLTDQNTSIFLEGVDGGPIRGTGPFRLVEQDATRVVLERNEAYWGGRAPHLDRIELRCSLDASGIAQGLLSGEIDLGRDLLPRDLEEVLRNPRFRRGLSERIKNNVYFVLFNLEGPMARHREVRQALLGVIRTRDLVWRTVGRFAQPAVCLIPPGILGHDPGRRYRAGSRWEALEALRGLGAKPPLRLRAAVHPLLQDRFGSLTEALLDEWRTLGVEVTFVTDSIDSYMDALRDTDELDLVLGRWNADYHDPDNFTYGLFHSRAGVYRGYYCSEEADRLLLRARQESRGEIREELYRQFEALLISERVLLPLFHDVDYRIASPRIRGLRLRAFAPYVNYAQLAKVESPETPSEVGRRSGGLDVPVSVRIETFDPAIGNILEYNEVTPSVFETLTRVDEGAQCVPWLCSTFEASEGGQRYRFVLRDNVRFHDGRRLTARDVRFTFERLLQLPRSELHFLLLPIRGAKELRDGESAGLAGFEIRSASELVLHLEQPLSMFPTLLAHPGMGIVPEGGANFLGSWRDGCAGTGPFRVVRFEPGVRIDLERNSQYWRAGYPRSDRLTFHCGISPGQILEDFREGRLSLASDLHPAHVEQLRRDPAFAGGLRESPRLSTYFLALNARRGPFADPALRRVFAESLNPVGALEKTLGRLVVPARGLLPPGLLGYEPARDHTPTLVRNPPRLGGVKLRVTMLPVYTGQYAAFWKRVVASLEELGLELDIVPATTPEVIRHAREGTVDLIAHRWIADYPDADTFVVGLVHSEEGLLRGLCDSPEIDRLGAEGRRETDPALRHAIYREIEEVFRRENLLIPLFHEKSYRFFAPEIKGVHLGLSVPEVRYEELTVRR